MKNYKGHWTRKNVYIRYPRPSLHKIPHKLHIWLTGLFERLLKYTVSPHLLFIWDGKYKDDLSNTPLRFSLARVEERNTLQLLLCRCIFLCSRPFAWVWGMCITSYWACNFLLEGFQPGNSINGVGDSNGGTSQQRGEVISTERYRSNGDFSRGIPQQY